MEKTNTVNGRAKYTEWRRPNTLNGRGQIHPKEKANTLKKEAKYTQWKIVLGSVWSQYLDL
jgi:hypothetical protein